MNWNIFLTYFSCRYETNMKRLSAIFRERPQTPRERATSWIEHILKFGSAHLRTPGHDMNFIEYYLVDVIGFMLLCLTLVLVLIYLGIKYTLRIVCSVFNHKKSKLAWRQTWRYMLILHIIHNPKAGTGLDNIIERIGQFICLSFASVHSRGAESDWFR